MKAESTPPSERFNVKCFSIIVAPFAIAAKGKCIPNVWSEKPISVSNFCFNNSITKILPQKLLNVTGFLSL